MNLDAVVINSAGNHCTEKDNNGALRSAVDTVPAVFEAPDYPLIVVGVNDFAGKQAVFSQGGDHVTILAPGVDVTCLKKGQVAPDPVQRQGTSFCELLYYPWVDWQNG